MINSAEKRRLIDVYASLDYARGALAKAIAGLVVVFAISVVGALTSSEEGVPAASQTARSAR